MHLQALVETNEQRNMGNIVSNFISCSPEFQMPSETDLESNKGQIAASFPNVKEGNPEYVSDSNAPEQKVIYDSIK